MNKGFKLVVKDSGGYVYVRSFDNKGSSYPTVEEAIKEYGDFLLASINNLAGSGKFNITVKQVTESRSFKYYQHKVSCKSIYGNKFNYVIGIENQETKELY